MAHTRWCHSLAGEEYARIYSWGNNPKRKGDHDAASPCKHIDLPQTIMEPILLKYASQHGFKCRMDTKFLSFEQDETGVTSTIEDIMTSTTYKIRSKYLMAADGARSHIVKQLGLELDAKLGGGVAIDVLVQADLSHLVKHRTGNLHWILQPDMEYPDFGMMGVARMVKPWNEWIFSLFPSIHATTIPQPTNEQYLARIKEFIGDDTPAEILMVSRWNINEIVAKEYSKGNVFCLGDAVHRHPPMNGLGSNTCIQDAYNLAWKLAHVLKSKASPRILDSYTLERQPVGLGIISRANDSFRNHRQIWSALAMLSPSLSDRKAAFAELSAEGAAGKKRRSELRKGIEHSAHEFHAIGIEMNQHYDSPAIFSSDELAPFEPQGLAAEDPVLYYTPNTFPGSRLPHAWLNKAVPNQSPISTIDLAGKGSWTIFTGIGGQAWKEAAKVVGSEIHIQVNAVSIGFRQDLEDIYGDWEKVRSVEEDGCILVRPDRFIAWRARSSGDEVERLRTVFESVLGRTTI
ncbi:hypothetical protein BP5796_06820 [Coleophoma crateriformis]|uniref:FAD-binding domain-containing protein n=1 Tax=Coleophoma crateriformis TaxID=565419 RepID=A0A3D8RPM4_9HELO|nr:hypothetical protein BP5796_06820 [Coleophoma crateriformis]